MSDCRKLEEFIKHLKEFMSGAEERSWTDNAGAVRWEKIDEVELRRGIIEDGAYFVQNYGADMIPQYVREIMAGPFGGRTQEDLAKVENEFSKLRAVVFSRDLPGIYEEIRPVFDESAATIREMKNALDKQAGILNNIVDILKREGARLEDIWSVLKSPEARDAKQAKRGACQSGDNVLQMLDKLLNQTGSLKKGVTMLLASDEKNITPSAADAAGWYSVSVRTIQNWMSGAIKCDDWPGNSAPMKVYRESAARYRAAHKKTDGADDEGTWKPGSSMLDNGEINNGYSIK